MNKFRVKFTFGPETKEIECEENEKLNEIYKRCPLNSKKDFNKIYFLYGGGIISNKEATLIQIANPNDKHSKTMTILVYEYLNELTSNFIICPKCGENAKIRIQNYKISIYDCKNRHEINDILFNKYEDCQKEASSKIVCNICNNTNMSEVYFYKCLTCDKNICEICKSKHERKHEIINYEENNYKCSIHNKDFIQYCNECKKNICYNCTNDHSIHKIETLIDMKVPTKEEIGKKLKQIKKTIDEFNNNINTIIKMLNRVKENINFYYNIINKIISNYNFNEFNYEMLTSIKHIYDNDEIIKVLNAINNKGNIKEKFNHILSINNNLNQIRLTLKVEKEDIGKNIYFLGDSMETYSGGKAILLKELNNNNVELFIDNKKEKNYEKYFKPKKEGIYNILINLNINLKDCTGMFFGCRNLTSIDLSNFDTSNINHMGGMFNGCNNLANVNLKSFDTSSVEEMNFLFWRCNNLKSIDLSNFDTSNVTDMENMFVFCENLTTIDLSSSFNTKNVKNMIQMFAGCKNLKSIDLSDFDTSNVTDTPIPNPQYLTINYFLKLILLSIIN